MKLIAIKKLQIISSIFILSIVCFSSNADLYGKIIKDKEITIATEARFAPFEYVEKGVLIGYDIDLMDYILQQIPEVKVKQLDLPFQGILPGLDAKKFDFVVTAVTVNQQRADRFAFTIPIAESTVALLKRNNDSNINSLEDLNGKIIGSQIGSGQLQILEAFNRKLKSKGGDGLAEIKEYVSFDEAYADLAIGRLDGVAQAISNLGPLIKSRPGVFGILSERLGPTTYFGWVGRKDKDSEQLVNFFSEGIMKANQDGTMKKLQMKWFGFSMELPSDKMPIPEL